MATRLQKLATLKNDPKLAIFDELQEVKELLQQVVDKEYPVTEIPPYPEMPEPQEIDLTQTNELLFAVLEAVKKDREVTVELDIV